MARGTAAEDAKRRTADRAAGKGAGKQRASDEGDEAEDDDEADDGERDAKDGQAGRGKDEDGCEAEDGDGEEEEAEQAEEAAEAASGKRKKSSSSSSSAPPSKKARAANDAHSAVLAYMTRTNRPYSAINVADNMQGAVSKSQAVKLLDELTQQGSVTMKEFGKCRVYWATQQEADASPDDVAKLDRHTEEVTDQLNKARSATAALQSELSAASAEPDDDALDAELAELEKAVPAADKKLAALKGGKDAMPAAEADALQRQFNLYLTEWKRRKRGCRELIGLIAEHAAKSWKEKTFCDDQGIETDEAVKAKLDEWQAYFRDVKPLPKENKSQAKGKKKK